MIKKNIERSINCKNLLLKDVEFLNKFEHAASLVLEAYEKGKRLLIIGNGGSAADAQHLAAEFVSKLARDRAPLPALALTVDSSMITAIGNDYGYDNIFLRQLVANGTTGDILLAISTSGKSNNVIKAAERAQKLNIKVIGLTGQNCGPLDQYCDVVLKVPSGIVAVIQECHILIEHSLCEHVEETLFGN